jgi:hypothetical protein
MRAATDLSAAAAPKNAYVPGVMHGTSGWQNAKMPDIGCSRLIALTTMPTMRPKLAPTAIDGTKMPAGTREPYETMTRPTRMTVARKSELTIGHCTDVLCPRQFGPRRQRTRSDALAEVLVVAAALALAEEDREALGHVDAQEAVEVADRGRDACKHDGLGDGVVREVLAPERSELHVELDHDRAVDALAQRA